jgi:enterochelin esterase-like enzyme
MLAGFSAGGYGAMNVGLRNLGTFGAVESWSGYFEATDPSGQHVIDFGSAAANARAAAPRDSELMQALAQHPSFIGFYVGDQDGFLDDDQAFDAALSRSDIPHAFSVYPGGHAVSLWTAQASAWLGRGLAALAALSSAS